MNTIERLECSVHALIEAHENLLPDIERNTWEKADKSQELEAAGIKIKELLERIEELEKGQERYKEIEKKKGQIKQQINIILDKLGNN